MENAKRYKTARVKATGDFGAISECNEVQGVWYFKLTDHCCYREGVLVRKVGDIWYKADQLDCFTF